MLDCYIPVWIWSIFDYIDGDELAITLNWLIDKSIIVCNNVI